MFKIQNMSSILFEIKKGVGHITLNRPDKFNSFNREMALAMQAKLDECASLHEVRAVYITGTGKAFSAGQDLGDPAMSGPVACIVDLYGPMDLMTYRDMKMFAKTRDEAPDLYRQASPLTYLDKGDPPTFVTHGTSDETVNIEQSEKLVAKLKDLGIPHEYVVVPQAPHSYDLRPLQMDLKPAVLAFLKQHLVDSPPPKP